MTDSAATIKVHPTDIPGLFDVELPDGGWRTDLTQGQVSWLAITGDARLEMVRDAK